MYDWLLNRKKKKVGHCSWSVVQKQGDERRRVVDCDFYFISLLSTLFWLHRISSINITLHWPYSLWFQCFRYQLAQKKKRKFLLFLFYHSLVKQTTFSKKKSIQCCKRQLLMVHKKSFTSTYGYTVPLVSNGDNQKTHGYIQPVVL